MQDSIQAAKVHKSKLKLYIFIGDSHQKNPIIRFAHQMIIETEMMDSWQIHLSRQYMSPLIWLCACLCGHVVCGNAIITCAKRKVFSASTKKGLISLKVNWFCCVLIRSYTVRTECVSKRSARIPLKHINWSFCFLFDCQYVRSN